MAIRGKSRLPWLLLLVAVTAVLPTNAVYNDNDIKSIVKNVVKNNALFTNFPKIQYNPTGTQFAVLILISQQDYANGNTNIKLIPPPTLNNIDNRYPVQPEPQVRVNYMVARPDRPSFNHVGREHSEKKLLDNLEQLLQKFRTLHGEPPAMVLLHTWATPCPKCTEELLNAANFLRQMYPRSIHFAVTYSVDREWRNSGMTFEVNKNNRQRLWNAGIRVLQIYENTMGPTPSSTNFGGMNNVRKHIFFDRPSSTYTTAMPRHIFFDRPSSTYTTAMPRHIFFDRPSSTYTTAMPRHIFFDRPSSTYTTAMPRHIFFDRPSSTYTTAMPRHIFFTQPPTRSAGEPSNTGQHTATISRYSKWQKLRRLKWLLANRRFNNNPSQNQLAQRSNDRIVHRPISKLRLRGSGWQKMQ